MNILSRFAQRNKANTHISLFNFHIVIYSEGKTHCILFFQSLLVLSSFTLPQQLTMQHIQSYFIKLIFDPCLQGRVCNSDGQSCHDLHAL